MKVLMNQPFNFSAAVAVMPREALNVFIVCHKQAQADLRQTSLNEAGARTYGPLQLQSHRP